MCRAALLFLLNHSPGTKCRWDALCCLLVFYVSLALPVEIAFGGSNQNFALLTIMDKVIDVLFIMDVYVNFRTGLSSTSNMLFQGHPAAPPSNQYAHQTARNQAPDQRLSNAREPLNSSVLHLAYNCGIRLQGHAGFFQQEKETGIWSLQMEPKACAFRYLQGWAVIDVLSVLPFDLMLISVKESRPNLDINLTSLPRCLKLLRLPRLFRCGEKNVQGNASTIYTTCLPGRIEVY